MLGNDENDSSDGGNTVVLFPPNFDLASILLRLAVGTLFIYHGYPKLTSMRKGEFMKTLGMPTALVPFGGFVEFFGGLGLLLGLLVPIVAILSALWMLSTIWFSIAKVKKKFMGGYELDIVLFLAAFALAFIGGGTFSLDHLIGLA
jgi:putative oxidoreductase